MDVARYRALKAERARATAAELALKREVCGTCRRERGSCLCARVRAVEAGFGLIVLLHPKEARKRVGTGRLTHLAVRGSRLFEGVDFTHDERVNAILRDERNFCVTLFPGPTAVDLTSDAEGALEALVPEEKKLVVFLADGSWTCAKTMLRLSVNLAALPRVAFTPPSRSNYKIRRQPMELCYSTIEATHWLLDELATSKRWPTTGNHHELLELFNTLVGQQLQRVTDPKQKAVRGKRLRQPLPPTVAANG